MALATRSGLRLCYHIRMTRFEILIEELKTVARAPEDLDWPEPLREPLKEHNELVDELIDRIVEQHKIDIER